MDRSTMAKAKDRASLTIEATLRRRVVESMATVFRLIESNSYRYQTCSAAAELLTRVIEAAATSKKACSFGMMKASSRQMFARQNDATMFEKLQAAIEINRIFSLRCHLFKTRAMTSLKAAGLETAARPSATKRLVKTQSLLLASAENVLFGLQVICRMVDRRVSSSFG